MPPSGGVADAGEEPRVGQRPFSRVILAGERLAKLFNRRIQQLQPAAVMRRELRRGSDHVERRTFLGAFFGEQNGAVAKVEGGKAASPRQRLPPTWGLRRWTRPKLGWHLSSGSRLPMEPTSSTATTSHHDAGG